MDTIIDKLEKAKQLRIERARATASIYNQIMILEKEMEIISKPYEDQYELIEEECRKEVMSFEKSFSCGFVDIKYRKGSIKSIWDTDKLKEYAKTHTEILDLKKESITNPSVSMNWKLF